MPTGLRSPRKRPRNDVDDYLDEVDSLLFCVTVTDRRCLNRDLKAHIKELTSDPSKADEYDGMYKMTKDQLVSDVGEPTKIATNYIASVSRRVPSLGLRIYILVLTVIFLGMTLSGVDRVDLSHVQGLEDAQWVRSTGALMAVAGAIGLGLTALSVYRFKRFHVLTVYLAVVALMMSIPYSSFLANALVPFIVSGPMPELHRMLSILLVADFLLIGVVGIYVYMNHYRVLAPKQDLMV